MSQSTWRKRQSKTLNCPSGNTPMVRRPGPSLTIKATRIARILQKLSDNSMAAGIETMLDNMAKLSDDEVDKLLAFARPLVVDVVESPALVMNPQEGQLGPDDLPTEDFWAIAFWAMSGGPDMPVKLAEGETSVEAVQTFPVGQDAGDNAGEDSPPM